MSLPAPVRFCTPKSVGGSPDERQHSQYMQYVNATAEPSAMIRELIVAPARAARVRAHDALLGKAQGSL